MLNKPKRIIISPPFGNYLNFDWATSVSGTFTLEKRSGLIKQTIKTIRPVENGWVNRIGFRNKGLRNVRTFTNDRIYSCTDISCRRDWKEMLDILPKSIMVEINLGCPNVRRSYITSDILLECNARFDFVSVKIPPTKEALRYIGFARDNGVRTVHLCNTIPTERGGESGKRLKELTLPLIEETKKRFPELTVIGGGGIYEPQDVIDYHNAGADYFSLATIFFTPWKVKKVKKQIDKIPTIML
ncbi:hypothetical protein LCGC14_0669330 [marine sediment metagenome]|uniref:Dihydroorotate dehydrogenase catalytic domain-containing protein n=1 Tax=marine sediment metagenome TaxID=412755 RepID=A0A0F9QWL6_9ZZZZ